MAVAVHINPEVRDLFDAHGLRHYGDFMALDTGGGLNNGGRCGVQLLSAASGARFYVKTSSRISPAVQLRLLLIGRAGCGPVREKQMLDRLREAGFAAMEPVAWGEKRVFGLPVAGFLVVREVVGGNVGELYDNADGLEKQRLMNDVGRLIGRLHASGFFHPVRLKDIMRTADGLVLIDRETSKPWRSRFSFRRCETLLARSVRRTLRGGHRIGAGSASAFMRGYIESIAARALAQPPALQRRLIKGLRRELNGRRIRKRVARGARAAAATGPRAAA